MVSAVGILVLAIGLTGATNQASNPSAPFHYGPSIVTPMPPQPGFNPLTATNTELIANAFSPRPSNPPPHWWINAVSGGTYIAPVFTPRIHHNTPLPPPEKAPSASQAIAGYDSSNWAGYVAGTGQTFDAVVATWELRSVTAPTGVNAYSSLWPGLGSGHSSSDQLMQAG